MNDYYSDIIEFYERGIPFNEWKKHAAKQRIVLENSSEIMLGILESQWEEISYHDIDRGDYCTLEDSPLEILDFCIADDFLTYPPPEILWVIARQFKWYMLNEGEITLEEAFFGKPIKGKGVYAKRATNKKINIYKAFHLKVRANPGIPQSRLLEQYCNNPPPDIGPSRETCYYIYIENQNNEIDQDSFLRGYRRWKEEKADKQPD